HDDARRESRGGADLEANGIAEIAQEGANRDEGEEAEDDGGNAGEDFDKRLGDGAEGFWGVLAEIDGREQADRYGDQHGDGRDHQRAGEQRQEAIRTVIGATGIVRGPDGAEEEIERADKGEEPKRLGDQRSDDAQSG